MRPFCSILAGIVLILGLLIPGAQAKDTMIPVEEFATLPILSEGRVMPVDSFARHYLYAFSGEDTYEGESAADWLARTVFDPASAVNDKIFSVSQKDQRLLGLNARQGNRYDFTEISAALAGTLGDFQKALQKQAEEKGLSDDEERLITWHERARDYAQILRAMSFAIPINLDVPERLQEIGAPATFENYAQAQRFTKDIEAMMRGVVEEKGADWQNFSAEEQKLAAISFQVSSLREGGQSETLFKVIPDIWSDTGNWVSPWQIYTGGAGAPQTSTLLSQWELLANEYVRGNTEGWTETVTAMKGELERLDYPNYDTARLSMEKTYNLLQPVKIASGLLLLSFLAMMGLYSLGKNYLLRAGQAFFVSGLGILGLVLAARIYIQARAPVGTLYESLLFVAFISGIFALALYAYRREAAILAAGIFVALFLCGLSFPTADGPQTLTVLEAVLNTQFWLMTHVICITIGYGWCLLAAALAHERLYRFGFRENLSAKTLPPLGRPLKLTLVTALLFTAVGTALGGVWADQSWGRFWGWDPKENGALLIVLWIAWLLHGRLSGHISRFFMLAGTAALSIIVALAWFGVNLLNVGLHSYGFTSGLAGGLFAFIFIELCIISAFAYKIFKA